MSDNSFEIVFYGAVVPGADPSQVRKNVAALFKIELDKIEPLFSGKRFVVKKGLDQATAAKYEAALRKAGAAACIENPAAARPDEAVPPVVPPVGHAETSASAVSTLAETTATVLAGATLDPPGVVLVEPEKVEPLQVDTSHLVLDQPGAILVPPSETPALAVNLDGITIAAPGVLLKEPEEVPPLEVDVSSISVAEPGALLVEPEDVSVPVIDTSGIQLAGD